MNITELEHICKSRSRQVFEDAKYCLKNHPFVDTEINDNIITDCVDFQIEQVLGSKILKDFQKKNTIKTP